MMMRQRAISTRLSALSARLSALSLGPRLSALGGSQRWVLSARLSVPVRGSQHWAWRWTLSARLSRPGSKRWALISAPVSQCWTSIQGHMSIAKRPAHARERNRMCPFVDVLRNEQHSFADEQNRIRQTSASHLMHTDLWPTTTSETLVWIVLTLIAIIYTF